MQRATLTFIIVIILIFAASLAYEISRSLENGSAIYTFILTFVIALILMGTITYLEMYYIFRHP